MSARSGPLSFANGVVSSARWRGGVPRRESSEWRAGSTRRAFAPNLTAWRWVWTRFW
jgi:hypothetical protein